MSDSYEVVLYEANDKLERFVQVWYSDSDHPYYFCYTYIKIFKWRLYTGKVIFGSNYTACVYSIERSRRKDTEKFPDLDKIAAYNKQNGITPYNDSN
jgi:predicted TIM-barrel fold metal-dependent hydrolase